MQKKGQGQVGKLLVILHLASKYWVGLIMDWPRIEQDLDSCEIKLEKQDNMNKTDYGELESQNIIC